MSNGKIVDSGIDNFYRGRSIFITGATGFMGKVLVEKLLRSCPGIKNIYVLMRPKEENVDTKKRLEELVNTRVIIISSLTTVYFPTTHTTDFRYSKNF